jgi:hydrogenase small subunit
VSKCKLLWLTSISCNGNAHSFLNYPYIQTFLNDFEFVYHPILESTYTLQEVLEQDLQCDIVLLEGAISQEFNKLDISITDTLLRYAKNAKAIVTVGTCATFGGIFKDSGFKDASGLHYIKDTKHHRYDELLPKTVSISGCPIQPEVLAETLYAIKDDITPKLDEYQRIKEFFAYTVHNGCIRNEYFEYKGDNHQFGHKEGCMFYDHGCQAPFTRGSCNKFLWNETNSKTRNGEPCHGCSEPNFPTTNLYKTQKNMGIPQNMPLGVNKRAYLTLAGVTKAFKIKRLEEDLF